MILVLCLNAAVDKTCRVSRLRLRRLNRLQDVLCLPGGKGINVARALRIMGEAPLVLGFSAGYTGDFIEEEVRREGLEGRWVRLTRGFSRTCLSILNGIAPPTEANEPGPRVARSELALLAGLFRPLARRSRLVVLSGSLPEGCPAGTYAPLIRAARALGRPVYLDTSGPALAPALAAGPDLVKLNAQEARSLGLRVSGRGWELKALRGLMKRGARGAVITLGVRGAVACLGGRYLRSVPPPVRVASPVGCGDTFLAALAHALLRGWSSERALAHATATATAGAEVLGAGVFSPREASTLLPRIRVAAIRAA